MRSQAERALAPLERGFGGFAAKELTRIRWWVDYDALEIPADPGLTVIAYTAEPCSPARQALDQLASLAATPGNAAQSRRTHPAAGAAGTPPPVSGDH